MFVDGYYGVDIINIGKELVKEYGDKYVNVFEEEWFEFFC